MSRIQSVPSTEDLPRELKRFIDPLRANVDMITGRGRPGKIAALPTTASTADIIAKVNEIIDRLQE